MRELLRVASCETGSGRPAAKSRRRRRQMCSAWVTQKVLAYTTLLFVRPSGVDILPPRPPRNTNSCAELGIGRKSALPSYKRHLQSILFPSPKSWVAVCAEILCAGPGLCTLGNEKPHAFWSSVLTDDLLFPLSDWGVCWTMAASHRCKVAK